MTNGRRAFRGRGPLPPRPRGAGEAEDRPGGRRDLGVLSAFVSGTIEGIPAHVTDWVVRIVVWVGTIAAASQATHRLLKDATDAVEQATTRPGGLV